MSRGEEAILGKFGGILRGFNIFVALTPSPFPTAWERGAARPTLWSAEASASAGRKLRFIVPLAACGRGGVGAHGGAPSPRPFGVLKRQLQRGGRFASALHSPPSPRAGEGGKGGEGNPPREGMSPRQNQQESPHAPSNPTPTSWEVSHGRWLRTPTFAHRV
jgi:hypothetical protein